NQKLSEPETKKIYSQRKIDVEPVFGFMKAILGFTRMSVRGINKVKRELGFVLMALNIRKIAAQRAVHYKIHIKKADFYQIINRKLIRSINGETPEGAVPVEDRAPHRS
ncbi:transposase, partial [Staphylococcus aureus]